MDDLTAHFVTSPKTVDMIKTSFKTHPQVWNDDKYKNMALDVMKTMGTNMLLRVRSPYNCATARDSDEIVSCPNVEAAVSWARMIITFEHYESGSNDIDAALDNKEVRSKCRDFDSRSLFKFFRKRTSCSCLKELHLQVRKSVPKSGLCWNCDKELERHLLMVCSRCMVTQYCSRKCQIADWPDHKEDCDRIIKAQK